MAALASAIVLSGCASAPEAISNAVANSAWAGASTSGGGGSPWTHRAFPGKRATQYQAQRKDGRDALMVHAVASASMLRRHVRVEPRQLGRVRFSWLVPSLIDDADLTRREHDDSPVRLVLAFEGDRQRFSARDAMLSELAETVSGEPLPYATLMYVWSNRLPHDAVVDNPRTARIRKVVVESGPQRLGEWLAYERDICADFQRAFGEAPGALVSIGIMTDTDNTRSQAQAWYGPVQHGPDGPGCAPAKP